MQCISNGNSKLSKGFILLNMGDFQSCCEGNKVIQELCECYSECYTLMYKSNPRIRRDWLNNTSHRIAKALKEKIASRKQNKVVFIRVNERGEVLDQADIQKLYRICREIPDYQFTVYTCRSDLDWSGKPDNLVLIESGHRDIPERTKSKIANATDVDYICDWHKTGKKCNQGCIHCYTKKKEDIAILIH